MPAAATKARIDINVASIKMASGFSGPSHSRPQSTFSCAGADPDHVKQRLATARCKCQGACSKMVPLSTLQKLCAAYWQMSEEHRAHMLFALHEQAQQAHSRKIHWALEGIPVCFEALTWLLKTSRRSLRKAIRGTPDCRKSTVAGERIPVPKNAEKSNLIHAFLSELYLTAAEPMPNDPACAALQETVERAGGVDHAIAAEADPWQEVTSRPADGADRADQEAACPDTMDLDIGQLVRLATCQVGKITGLPAKKLPWGKVSALYFQFQTWWDQQAEIDMAAHSGGAPSRSAFYKVWTQWEHVLKFRKISEHAQCITCFELQQVIRSRKFSKGDKVQACIQLRTHIMEQYLDRTIYWALRFKSRQRDGAVLTIIIDSMDKAKFAWPKWPFGRVPKSIEKFNRPRCTLTAAIAHGYCTSLFMSSEDMNHGADHFCDVLCQLLEQVAEKCAKLGVSMPHHLVVLSDNTTSQAKNSQATLFLAALVARRKFVTANLFFLIVGHTREDVDQHFALATSLIKQQVSFQTPAVIMSSLAAGLRERVAARGEDFHTVHLPGVRDFQEWMAPVGVHLHSAFGTREGIEAPHSFTFKLRENLNMEERRQLAQLAEQQIRRPRRPVDASPGDVMACVKTYLRDTKLSQPPLLVLPSGRAERIPTLQPTGWAPRKPWNDKQIEGYLNLAHLCQEEFDMPAAATALAALVNARAPTHLPASAWLAAAAPLVAGSEETSNPFFNHLPEFAWELQADLHANLRKRKDADREGIEA